MHKSWHFTDFLVIFVLLFTSGCGSKSAGSSDIIEGDNTKITPTLHTAFQVTSALEEESDPTDIIDVHEDFSQSSEVTRTAVPPSNTILDNSLLIEGEIQEDDLAGELVVGSLDVNPDGAIVGQVILDILSNPDAESGESINSGSSAIAAEPPLVSDNTLPPGTALVVPVGTRGPICGDNRYHNVGQPFQGGRMPVGFEEFGTWMRSATTYGALLDTDLLVHSGAHAAWLCYFFNTAEDETAVFTQIRSIPGQPDTVRVWVYGNGSGHYLGVWIMDDELETWLVPVGPVKHEGWKMMEASFAGDESNPIYHVSGPSNQQIDFPISFYGISLNDVVDNTITHGSIIIDDIEFFEK